MPRLLRLAYSVTPGAFIEGVNKAIDSENAQSGNLLISTEIDACWDEHLGGALLNKVSDPSLKLHVLTSLFALLIQHDTSGWRELADSFVFESALQSEPERSRMLATTLALMTNASDGGWSTVWPIISQNNELDARRLNRLRTRAQAGNYSSIS